MTTVNLLKQDITIKVNSEEVKKITGKILSSINLSGSSVNILFTSNKRIRALNRRYLRKNYSTDVMAFGAGDLYQTRPEKSLLGDIVISVEKAASNAKKYGKTFKEEMYLYIIHGILHLTGYNDNNRDEIRMMRKKENELLQKIGKFI